MTQRSSSRLLNLWSSSRSLATTVFSPMDKPWEQSRMKTDQSKNLVNYFSLSVCNGQCASVQISGTYNGQLQNATLYTCDPSSVCAALQMTNNCSSPEPGLTGCCCDTVSIGLQEKSIIYNSGHLPQSLHWKEPRQSSVLLRRLLRCLQQLRRWRFHQM